MIKNEIIVEAIQSIPSLALREHLCENMPEWTIMQAATVASECMGNKAMLANYFSRLYRETADGCDKALLHAAISELRATGCIGEKTEALFDKNYTGKFPLFPFLENCFLPVLFKPGDVIVSRNCKKTFYLCVDALPRLKPGTCDFSDECYYCHDLDTDCSRTQLDEGYAHYHIHMCDAEPFDEMKLTAKQKRNLVRVREYIASKHRKE